MSFVKFVLLLSFLFCLTAAANRCRALILQGAGDQGFYQAGALQGLIQNLPADQVAYDVIAGNGIGAITAGLASQYVKGNEQAMASNIVNTWSSFTTTTWYKNWTFGIISGLTTQSGFFNTAPAKTFLSAQITKPAQRTVIIGTTNAVNATYVPFHNFNGTTLLAETLQTGVLASYSIGGIFPFVRYSNDLYLISGSTLKNIDFAGPINACRSITKNDDSLIDIDIILTTGKVWSAGNIDGATSLKMLFVGLNLMNFESTSIDLSRAFIEYPRVNFRYVVGPSQFLPSSTYPLTYDSTQRESMIELGRTDASNIVSLGEGANWKEYVKASQDYLAHNSKKYSEIKEMRYSELLKKAYEEESKNMNFEEDLIL